MDILTNSIKNGISVAYISLLNNFYELFKDNKTFSICEVDTDIESIVTSLKDIYLNIDSVVGANNQVRGDYIATLKAHHTTLEYKYKILSSYSRELTHISFKLEETYHLKNTDIDDIKGLNYHQFIHDAIDFIEMSETETEKMYKMQSISKFIPMRMTRDYFLSYVKSAISQVSSHDNELFLDILKQLFDGRLTTGYGLVFKDLAIAIEDIRDATDSNLTITEIEDYFDDIFLLKETIEEFYNVCFLLHSSISNLYILVLLDNLDFDMICSEHIAFHDLYLTIKSLIDGSLHGEDLDIITETLPDRLEDVYMQVNEDFNDTVTKFNKDESNHEDTNLGLVSLLNLIQFYLSLDIQDIFAFHKANNDKTKIQPDIISSGISFLKEQINNNTPKERKLRMQYLVSLLPINMNSVEFANYLSTGIDGTSNEIKKAYSLAKITDFMNSCGFFEKQESTEHDHGHEHHIHDHNCNHIH